MSLVLLCAMPAPAQSRLGNGRTVLAAVVDERGLPVVDVGLDDFVVTEGAEPRVVLDVHVADYPLAVVVDDRPATLATAAAVRAAARRFIQRVGERPVALLRLTDGGHPLATLDDGRPVVLVRGELLPAIIDSGAAVHVVQAQGVGDTPADDAPTDLLRVVADQTRGQFTAIYSAASYEAALDRLADRLAIEMMVQYLAPDGARTGDVRVGVRRPGARVVGLGVK